eukprot:scaffold1997_cov79-Cyclotella_meneghiniana.AAC.2
MVGWLCTHVVNDRLSEDRRDGEEVGEEPTEQPRQEGPPWTSGSCKEGDESNSSVSAGPSP